MFSTITFFTVPSAQTTTRITMVFICHLLCFSSSRFLYLLFFLISFSAMLLSDGTVISISLRVGFNNDVRPVRCYSSTSIDWHVLHDGEVVAFIVYHSLWCVLVPFVCDLEIMIFTDTPM